MDKTVGVLGGGEHILCYFDNMQEELKTFSRDLFAFRNASNLDAIL